MSLYKRKKGLFVFRRKHLFSLFAYQKDLDPSYVAELTLTDKLLDH